MMAMTCTLTALGLLIALAAAGNAEAKSYPARPIRLIVVNAPGSSLDTVNRIVAGKLSDALGQQMVVDNRAGAGGTIGTEIAARATPDGYTLMAAGANMDTIARIVTPKMSDALGQQFVIDNRGGAGGIIGIELGARATSDGYTLTVGGASSMVISSFTYKKLAFDTLKDFELLAHINQ
jgi:tripartite-type tricarboxylate transporter receptor subunit TctC